VGNKKNTAAKSTRDTFQDEPQLDRDAGCRRQTLLDWPKWPSLHCCAVICAAKQSLLKKQAKGVTRDSRLVFFLFFATGKGNEKSEMEGRFLMTMQRHTRSYSALLAGVLRPKSTWCHCLYFFWLLFTILPQRWDLDCSKSIPRVCFVGLLGGKGFLEPPTGLDCHIFIYLFESILLPIYRSSLQREIIGYTHSHRFCRWVKSLRVP